MSGYLQEEFLFFLFCVHVSRCGDVYNKNNSLLFCFIIFVLFEMLCFVFSLKRALLCDSGQSTIQ